MEQIHTNNQMIEEYKKKLIDISKRNNQSDNASNNSYPLKSNIVNSVKMESGMRVREKLEKFYTAI